MIILSLAAAACTTSVSQITSDSAPVKVSKAERIRVPLHTGNEIAEWENAVAQQTKKLVAAGQHEIGEIIDQVSCNTRELEQQARAAYIQQFLDAFMLIDKNAATLMDPEIQGLQEQFSVELKEIRKDIFDKNFTAKKYKLIEKNFLEAIALQQ